MALFGFVSSHEKRYGPLRERKKHEKFTGTAVPHMDPPYASRSVQCHCFWEPAAETRTTQRQKRINRNKHLMINTGRTACRPATCYWLKLNECGVGDLRHMKMGGRGGGELCLGWDPQERVPQHRGMSTHTCITPEKHTQKREICTKFLSTHYDLFSSLNWLFAN